MSRLGFLHGGVHAVLLDTVMGYEGCFMGDANAHCFTVTANLNLSFLAQSRGITLLAEGRHIDGEHQFFLLKDGSKTIQVN